MKDVNKPLKKALFANLLNVGPPVYNGQVPDQAGPNYIVFSSLVVNPVSQKSGDTVTVSTQVTIYTERAQYNSGDAVDEIANNVYLSLYPQPSFKLPMERGFVMMSTDLQSDNTNTWKLKDQIIAIDRTITFLHKIFIE